MRERIITSSIEKRRNPAVACALSVLATGLGQIYNGDGAGGVVFFLFRLLTVLMVPVYLVFRPSGSFLLFVGVMFLSHALIWAGSVLESFRRAYKIKTIVLKKYNRAAVYALFTLCTQALLALSLLLLVSLLDLCKIPDDRMEPTLAAGEWVLVNRFSRAEVNYGDVVWIRTADGGRAARIIGKAGDRIAGAGAMFSVNGLPLPVGLFTDSEAKGLGLVNSDRLYYETRDELIYPISARESDLSPRFRKTSPQPVPEGGLVVGADNRTAGAIPEQAKLDDVVGRVEGIAYGGRWGRIFKNTYIKK